MKRGMITHNKTVTRMHFFKQVLSIETKERREKTSAIKVDFLGVEKY